MNGLNLDQFYNLSIRLNNSILNSSGGILGLECQNGGCPNNLTNSSAEFSENPEKVYSALLLILLPILAVLGNILVILSVYKEKSLQSVTNYFIVSLGLADLLVACFVMPFAVYYLVNGVWELSETICDFWIAFDVTLSTASILNLVAISIDRFMAVTRPIKYAKHKSNNRVGWTIAIVWIISVAIGSPIVLGLNTSPQRTSDLCIFYNSDFIIYSSLGSFYIPCLLMVFLYYRIFKAIHDRAKKSIGSSSSKPQPSSATGVGVKTQGAVGGGGTSAPGSSIAAVKGAVKQVATVRNSSADAAIVIENTSLTARLKNTSFVEAASSVASSSNAETGRGGGGSGEGGGGGGDRTNRLPLIRESTTTGNSDGQECEEDEDDEDESDEDDDDDLPGDSDIEAVECKVIKNKKARECVVNVVEVDATRSFKHEGGMTLDEEEEEQNNSRVASRQATRNGNPDSGYAPSNAEESQFCVRNVHVLECDDITGDKKIGRTARGGGRRRSPSLKLGADGGKREVAAPSPSSRLTPSPLLDETEDGQEDDTSTCIAGTVRIDVKGVLPSGHESVIPVAGAIAVGPSTISQVTQDLTANIKKKSRFKLGRKHKTSSKKKKREKASAKRERKATKTLAIVLGVFLFCWVPFFTCNIMDAICIKLDKPESCRVSTNAFLLTTWLGYLNSIVNPVIYTIFNPEFRKAFKKILGIK